VQITVVTGCKNLTLKLRCVIYTQYQLAELHSNEISTSAGEND